MYYEEKWIDGLLHCRTTPGAEWQRTSHVVLATENLGGGLYVAYDSQQTYRAFGRSPEAAKKHYCERHRVQELRPSYH